MKQVTDMKKGKTARERKRYPGGVFLYRPQFYRICSVYHGADPVCVRTWISALGRKQCDSVRRIG